jgi:signal transduction histidine kinase/ferredoxin-like protein FixX
MEKLIEVIGIKEENCINCHQCIAVCPVKICSDGSGDVVKFNNNSCIACGKCIEACIKSHRGVIEKSARYPIDDAKQFSQALNNKKIIALVAPSAQGNFTLKKLITALKMLDIEAVYDVSLGAEITAVCYHQAIESGKARLPLIGQSCPVIVKYIELYYPELIKHLAPSGSPVHDVAIYVKSLHPDCELAFISPCLAKRREFQDSQMIEYNVTFQSLVNIFKEHNIDLDTLEDGEFDNAVSAGIATAFSTPGGLKAAYLHHYPDTPASAIARVEGKKVYKRYLRELEKRIAANDANLPLIIDILSCENGCNIGPGCINCRTPVDETEALIARRAEEAVMDGEKQQALGRFLEDIIQKHNFDYCNYRDLSSNVQIKIPSESELQKIYADMHKVEERDFRNCAACGYNSCRYMAIAIYNGLNKVENCHLYQEKELLREHEILSTMVEETADLNMKLQREIEERKQQEQLLVQNSKLAAMGEMIGMIAHQWRQPLSSISTLAGNLQVFIDLDMYDDKQFGELLDAINNHAQYLSSTINDFRHFFKPDNPQDIALIDDVIGSTLGIIGKSLEYKKIGLVKDYLFTKPILTYPNELMQVFLNIIKNAADVFIDQETADPEIVISGYEENGFQVVEIKDNGGGIPEEIMERIFDPYFSTKGAALGTGLGLYMSKVIVEEHCGGELLVSNLPKGACFSIKLPVLQEGGNMAK